MSKLIDKFYDFAFHEVTTFVIVFAVFCCLIITPLNISFIKPIEKAFNIPDKIEVHDEECSGFGYYFTSCKKLETTHLEPTRPMTYLGMYFIEFIFFSGLGYVSNKIIVKKLS